MVVCIAAASIVGCNQPATFDQVSFDRAVDSTFNAKRILMSDSMNKACIDRMKIEMPAKLDSTLSALKLK